MASTISFSGLSASGLDTSSWVDALVSVKQQTVTSLESQKAEKENLLSIVNNIKSYFSSFQSCLQKLTDSQYGIASMDLFMQNLALSSNANIATATATTEAARQSYDVAVDSLATATKATSGYSQFEVKTADLNTTFGTLGGKNGTITVNSQSFNVTTDDTLGSLVDKFKNVGVDASFDEKKGTFTVGIDLDKIDEGATNLKNALKLKNNNVSGAVSGSIVYANRSTEFSKLGLTAGKITIEGIEHTIAKNGGNYTIQKAGGSAVSMNTLGEFFDYLKSSAVGAEDASVDGKGNITIKGATLDKVEGGSNLMEVLNLIESQKRTVSESGALSYVEVRNADLNTKLSALGVTGDTTLVAGGTNNTISNDKTLGDIQKILKNAGVEMNVDNRGVITIDTKGNEISGTLLDVLNLDPTKGGTTISSSAHQANLKADLNTKLSELGVKDSDKYIAYKSDGTAVTVEMTNLSDKSINTLITDLKNVGLDANFDEKTHQIVIKDGYITGTLADVLGMTQSTTSYTENATLNTTLSALGATGDSTLTIDGGTSKTYDKNTTLETVFDDIKDAGGKVTFKDGNVTIEGVTLGGSIPALLGLDATTQGTSVTSGKLTAVTGSSSTGGGNNATVEHDIDLNTKIGDITGTTSSYTLKVGDGTSKTYTKDTTLQELKNQIESAGGKFTINDDNTISIDGVTMSGTLVGVLGFDELETGTRFTTVDAVMISGTSNVATGDTTLGNLGLISGSTSGSTSGARAVRRAPANPNKTLSINGGTAKSYGANSSLDDIFADIVAAGGTASIDDEGYINIKGVHLEGTLVDALGLVETDYKTTITSGNLKVTTSTSSTSSSVLYSEQKGDISLNSTVGSIVGDSESYNLVVNGTNNTIGTNTKLSDIRTIIQNAGGTMTVNDDNTISVNGVELSGSLVDKLGFMSNGVHTVVSSNNPIYYTDGKKSADSGSTFEQLGISADKRDFAIYKNDGTLVKASSTTGSASGKTIGDWLKMINDALNSANGTSGSVYATINNGVISISGGYVTGSLPTELGIGTTQTLTGITMEGNSVTYTEYDPLKYIGNIQTGSGTAAGNVTSTGMIGAVVEYTDELGNVLQANENTKLADILDTSGNKLGSGSFTFNVGSYTKTFDADSTTLGDVRDYVNNLNTDTTYDTNTSASIADGKIAIESNVDITGTLMSALGFAKSDVSSIAYEVKGTGKAHYSSVDSTTYTASGFTKATETKTGNVTIASLKLPSGFATTLNIVDTSDAISLSSVSSESSLVNGKKYSISTKEDLIKLAEFSKSWNYYGSNRSNIVWVLTNDIDMSGVTDFTGVEYLFGTFSGNGHVIKNLTINDNSTRVGLFKCSMGTIQDLGLENANITHAEDSTNYVTSVGALVGWNKGNIRNCYANNSTVTAGNGVDYAGGLIGSNGAGETTYSWTNVQVNCASTKTTDIGGFVGANQGSSSTDNPIISKCFSVSNLRTDKNAGFCGDLSYYYPKIQDCFSVGINSGVCSSTATYIEYQQANDNSLTKVSSGSLVSLKSKIDALGFDNLNWNVEEKELRVSEADSFEVGMTYHISTVADLQKLSSYSNTRNSSGLNGIDEGVNFVLDNDIDMSSVSNFVGIANFKGNFYGNGHVIKNLKISESSSGGDAGLFKSLSGTVQDLGLENVTITTNNSYGYTPRQMSVGALVGELFNGKIENCYVSGGTISGNATYMGGLVGSNKWNGGTISDCWANVTVNKTSYSKDKIGAVGGLVAISGGTISNSYSLGDVNSAYGYVGGFVGIATGTISNSFSTGNVKVTNSSSSNTTYTGGFAGAFGMTSTMKNDYQLDDDVTVTMSNNYSTGTVTASKGSVGGFVGTIITSSSGTSASDYTMSNNFSDSGSASKAIGSGSVSGISAVANSEINSGVSGLGFSNLTMTKVVNDHTATTSTKIKDLIGKGGSQTLTLTPTAGGEAVTLTFNETDTIQTVIDKLKAQGIDEADLTDGIFRVKDDKQWTISGALANKLFGGADDVYTYTGSKVTYTTTGAGTAGSVTGDKVTYETTGTGSAGSVTGDKLTYTVSTADGSIVSNEMLYKKLANNSMSISGNQLTYTGTGTGSGSSGFVFNPDILDDPSRYQVVLANGINGNSTLSEILNNFGDTFEDFEPIDLLSKDDVAIDGLTADMTLNQLCEKLGWEYSNHTLTAISNTETCYSGRIMDALFQGSVSFNPENTVPKTYLSSVSGNLSTGKSYWIKSVEDLQKLAAYSQNNDTSLMYFILDNDIDMSGVNFDNFDGISNFKGTFYGQGHTISNLTTSLFNSVSGNALVKDVGLLNSSVSAYGDATGLLADSVSGRATIMNCYVTGELGANGRTVGGLVGAISDDALISASSANVTISGSRGDGSVIGGLVGEASGNAQIRYSHSSGSIDGSTGTVGGFVGQLKGSVAILNGYTTVDVDIVDCNFYGAFAGNICEQVGSGGVEAIGFSGTLSNVFATANAPFASLMDFEDGATIENVIYNSEANTSTYQPDLFANNAIGLTLAQMQDGSTMQNYGFTLENNWNTSNGIPDFTDPTASNSKIVATGSTTMAQLGITDFTINGEALSGINADSTVVEVFTALKNEYGIEASISNGIVTFSATSNNYLEGEIINKFIGSKAVEFSIGLNGNSIKSNKVQYSTIETTYRDVYNQFDILPESTNNTKIFDLYVKSQAAPSGKKISSGSITIASTTNEYSVTFTINSSTTVADLKRFLAGEDCYLDSIDGNGGSLYNIVSNNGSSVSVSGDIANDVGGAPTIGYLCTKSTTSSEETVNHNIDNNTTIGQIFGDTASHTIKVGDETVTLQSTDKLSTLVSKLADKGVTAEIKNSALYLTTTNSTVFSGDIISRFFGQDKVIAGGSTYKYVDIELSTKFSDMEYDSTPEFEVDGTQIDGLTKDSTIQDLFNKLASKGINASLSNGKITLTSDTEHTLTGTAVEDFFGGAVTVGSSSSTITHTAKGTTKMSELGITDFKVNGSALSGITGDSTVNDVLSKLKSTYGLSEATISDGKITLKSNSDTTLSGNLIKSLMGQDSVTITPTSGTTTTTKVYTSSVSSLVQGETYYIKTGADLKKSIELYNNNSVSGITFVLDSDIDLTGVIFDEGFNTFNGKFYGNGHTISGLTSSLFGDVTENAVIKDVGLVNSNINYSPSNAINSDTNYVGILADSLSGNAKIENSYVSNGNLQLGGYVACAGGLVGNISGNAQISYSHADVTINADSNATTIGGLVGEADSSAKIDHSFSSGTITTTDATDAKIGGFIGQIRDSVEISNSYTTVGINFNSGNTCGAFAGGIYTREGSGGVEAEGFSGKLSNVYATDDNFSFVCDIKGGTYTNVIYNSSYPDGIDEFFYNNATGLTLAQMQDGSTMKNYGFTEDNGWYFTSGSTPTLSSTGSTGGGSTGGTSTVTATGSTTLGQLGFGLTDASLLVDGNIVYQDKDPTGGSLNISMSKNTTIDKILSALQDQFGITGSITDGKVTLTSDTEHTLTGTVIKKLFGQDSVTITPTAGGSSINTATENTTLGELGLTSFDLKINGTSISGLSADSKISDVFAKLADSNITATMTDGKITLTSNEATTLSGTVAEKLLGSSSVTLAGDSTEHTFDMEQISASKSLYTSRALTYNSGAQKVSEVTELVAGNKYHIASEADLVKLAEFVNSGADTTGSIFIFDNDIDMSSVANFTSIGNDASHAFKGTIYGNGHVVKNLKIDSTSDYQGLFGYVQQATIQDLGVEDANIKGGAYSGILFGRAENAKLTNLYATGTVSGSSFVGGLVGSLKDSVLEKSYSTATVNVSKAAAGGLVGSVVNSTLETVYATGDVNCAASGVVGIFTGTGGLVGTMQSGGTIKNAFATGSVTTKSGGFNGGLVGFITKDSSSYTIDTVYATGNVKGSGGVNGGLIGAINNGSSATITNAIYNKNSVSNGVGNGSPDGITGKNYEQMLMKSVMQNAGFTEDKGWVYKDGATPTFGNMTVSGGGGKVYLDDTITSFTSGSAYYISSLEQLNKLASLVNSGASTAGVSFILENDIDVSAFTTAIGSTEANAFKGTFYGNGHALTGLKTNLFNYIDGEAVIRDLGLENMNGGYLATSVRGNSTIDNVYSTGSTTVAGLVNKLGGSATIKNSYSTATVNSSSASAGGLVAQMADSATIDHSYFGGRVQVGSYYTAGGLVGSMAGGTIKSSYSTASIASGDVLRGGLVGEVTGSVTIQNSYASGTTDGGLIGENSGSVTSSGNVYNSANSNAVGSGSSISGVTALSLADMKSQAKMEALGFTASNGWHYYADKTPMLQGQDTSSGHSANVSLNTKIDSILNSGEGRNVKVTANGTTYEKWFEPTDTVKDVRDWLNTIDGVTATFDETNSTFKVSGTSEDFKIDGDLASALFGGRKTTTKTSATVNTDSNELLVDGSQTKITNNTTVGQLLGKASGNYAIGFYDDNGNLVTKNFGVDTKLSEVLQYLKDNGFEASITNGVFTATKDGNTTTDILGTIGNKLKGETGTVTTTDTGYQTGVLGSSSSVKATASTKLSELGIDSGSILIKDNNNNNLGTIQINNSMTIDDTAQLLANYGFTLTITDGKVTVAGEGINRLADGTSNLVSKMKLDNWTETKDKLKTTSTVAQMGFAKGATLGLVLDSKTYNLTFDANATLQDIIDTLGTYGVTASVDSDGKFTATASGNLVLTNELGAYLTKNSAEGYVKEADGYKSKDPLEFKGDKVKLDYDSKVGDILGTGKDGVLRLTIDNTTVVDLRYRADETMSDIIADLKGYGITATINDGVLTAVSDGHTFRFSGEIGKIISGDTPLYEDISTGYKSKDLSYETTGKATLDNTLKEMGISSGQIHVLSNDGKIVSTLDVDNSYTVAQVKSLLQPFGMDLAIDADGKVTVTSSEGYKLSDGTSNMVSTMKLNSWTTTTEKLTGATTLSQMGFKDGADLNLFLDGAVMNVLSFNADQTLDDISFALSAYGIDASVNADGQFTATSKTHTFIMSGGLGSYLTKGTGGYVNSDTAYKSYKPLTEEHPYITDTSKELGYKKLMTESSTLDSLGFAQGGSVRIMLDGTTPYSLEFLATDTVQDVIYALSAYGINAEVKDGKFVAESVNNTFTITGNFGSYLVQGGAYNNEVTGYESAPLTYNTTEKLTNDTKLSSLGVTRGAINVIKDGKVADTINITNDTTIGQLFSAIKPYGMSGSIVTDASGNTSIRISADSDIKLADGTSNVVSALGLHDVRQGDFEGHKEYWDDDATSGLITEGMLLSSLDRNGFIAQGSLIFTTGEGEDAVQHIINITADETVGSLLKKFNDSGIKAELDNGIIKLTGGLDKLTFNGGTSGLVKTIGLDIHNIDKYASSSSALTYEGETHYSASNFANANTTLDIVNATDGIMSVFVDGIKCNVEVKSSDTFAKLFKKIKDTVKAKSGFDIEVGFMTKDGTISSNPTDANNTGIIALSVAEGHELVIGASNDTTNFATIANLNKTGYNTITGSRALYRVNVNSLITQSGLYRDGDITEGTFIIGDAEFTIDSTTTLSSLINQINKNDKAYANAYWDTLSGTLVIQSTNTGASLINIEAGTSNFTDIMGFTKTKDGVSALVTDSQTLGQNAVVRINGTTVTSATNVITSDISRIKGLTINLKNVSEGETVTITVEQDKESIYNAVSDTLDSYNAMMEALNKELSDRSSLGGESILKLMRNNLKRLMTSSLTGAYVFKNLASVGISTGEASDKISTNVTSLLIDKDKFMDALNTDSDAVQDLLVGTKANPGIFLQANNIVESSIKTDGYFSNMANTLTKSINNIDKKITKTNNDIENYRTKLQSKFHNMELTISGLQSAYANLLG